MSESKDKTTTTTPNGSSEIGEFDQTSISIPCSLTIFYGQEPQRDSIIWLPCTITITGIGRTTIKNGTYGRAVGKRISGITLRTPFGLLSAPPSYLPKSLLRALKSYGPQKKPRMKWPSK